MTPEQWTRFDQLVQDIEKRAPPSQEKLKEYIAEQVQDEEPDVRRMMRAYFSISVDPIRNLEGKNVGNFRLGRLIGEGAMGAVYLGQELTMPLRNVAIKLIHPRYGTSQSKGLFIQEVHVYRNLKHHPHILPLLSAGIHTDPQTEEEIPYSVMPFIEGQQSMTAYIRSNKLDDLAKLHLFSVLCNALRHLHQNGIIHGDIKPGNVLIDRQGQLFVIDFGRAGFFKTLKCGNNQIQSKQTESMTPYDHVQGFDITIDIYALGVLLGEIFVQQPIHRCGPSSYFMRFINRLGPGKDRHVMRDISPADTLRCHQINKIRRKAMNPEGSQYSTVADMHKDIGRLIADVGLNSRYLKFPLKGILVILVIGLCVEVFGFFTGFTPAEAGGYLLICMSGILGAVWLFLLLTFQYVKYLAPALNTTLFFSYGIGIVSSLIGGLLYAFGPPAYTDPSTVINSVWQIKLLRFMAIGILLPIFYGSVFSLSVAKRRDPSFRVAEWRVMVWAGLCFFIGALIYTCVHLTEISSLSLFFGAQKQGDVRCEIFVLVAYLCSLSLIAFDNWTNESDGLSKVRQNACGSSFMARTVTSICFVTISGFFLATQFWGQGLTPNVNNGAFGILTIALISAWSISCHFLFTGNHVFVGWIDRNLATTCLKCWMWIRGAR